MDSLVITFLYYIPVLSEIGKVEKGLFNFQTVFFETFKKFSNKKCEFNYFLYNNLPKRVN